MEILIIEDELKTAQKLGQYIEELRPAAKLLNALQSVDEAVDFLKEEKPDLIFMDIELADGLSFDIFKEVKVECPVVFCTAYDEYALEAFHTNGIAYVLKPFDKIMVKEALDKVDRLAGTLQQQPGLNEIAALLSKTQEPHSKKSFLVFHKQKYIPVETSDIAFFHVENEITFIHTFEGHRFSLDHSLDQLQVMLDVSEWYRANRQFLIHYKSIAEIEHYFARKLLVHLKLSAPDKVIVSKAKASDFMNWMASR